MANQSAGALPAATLPLSGADLVHVVQGGNSRKATVGDVAAASGGGTLGLLNALEIAALQGDTTNLVGGIADPFADESDIDVASSTDETYDAAGDYYHNPAAYTADLTGGQTFSASAEYSAPYSAGKAFDDDSGTWWLSNAALPQQIKCDFGTGTVIGKYTVTAPGVDRVRNPGSWTFEGSNDNSNWDVLDTQSAIDLNLGETQTFVISNTSPYRYYQLNISARYGSTSFIQLAEMGMMGFNTSANLLLQSNAFTADAPPDEARILIQMDPVDAITINTDVIASVSRDDGTTWTPAVLGEVETVVGGVLLFEDDTINISGQPSGTSVRYKIQVNNNKEVRLHGVALQWS